MAVGYSIPRSPRGSCRASGHVPQDSFVERVCDNLGSYTIAVLVVASSYCLDGHPRMEAPFIVFFLVASAWAIAIALLSRPESSATAHCCVVQYCSVWPSSKPVCTMLTGRRSLSRGLHRKNGGETGDVA